MSLSASQQRNAVSEGFALGLISNGYRGLRDDKVAIDLSVEEAWSKWSERSRFPQVSTDLRKGLAGSIVMSRRQGVPSRGLVWSHDPEYQVLIKVGELDPRRVDDLEFLASLIRGKLSLDQWKALGRLLVEEAGDELLIPLYDSGPPA